jgi:hypothetical protein
MSKALFVDRKTIVKKSPLNGSVDPDKLMQYIELAQDIHIQTQLGTDLYEKLQADIIDGTLAGNYETLVNTHIKPMLIHYSVMEYLHYAAYEVSNGGVFRHTPENAQLADKTEIDFLISKEKRTAEFYTERFNEYMRNNQRLFPEYLTNSNGDMYPSRKTDPTGWVLDSNDGSTFDRDFWGAGQS